MVETPSSESSASSSDSLSSSELRVGGKICGCLGCQVLDIEIGQIR